MPSAMYAFASTFAASRTHGSTSSEFCSSKNVCPRLCIASIPSVLQNQLPVMMTKRGSTRSYEESKVDAPAKIMPEQIRIPFLSSLYDIATRSIPTIETGKRYGDIYRTSMFGFSHIVLTDLEDITKAYKNPKLFASKNANAKALRDMFGKSIIIELDGAEHMKTRSLIQPAFSPQMFSLYFERVGLAASQLWEYVSNQMEHTSSVTLSELLKQHYLRIIINISTGRKLSADLSSDTDIGPLRDGFIKLVNGFNSPEWSPGYSDALDARDHLLSTLKSIIRERLVEDSELIQELRKAEDKLLSVAKQHLKSGRVDILTVAIASSSLPVGKGEIPNEKELEDLAYLMLSLWFAGYSTQSSTTLSAILELHFHKDIKQQLISEQEALVRSSGDREITYEQVMKKMPLLDSYISEVMRLYPAASTLSRRLTEDAQVCGFPVKKGEIITFDIWTAHRDPKYYEDPEELKIDRFIGSKHPMPHETLAFGATGGPHFCVGAALARINMKSTLGFLLRNFDFSLDPTQTQKHVVMPEVEPLSGVKLDTCRRKI